MMTVPAVQRACELVELLHQLLYLLLITANHDRDAGDLRILRRADGEGVDIEAAAEEQT